MTSAVQRRKPESRSSVQQLQRVVPDGFDVGASPGRTFYLQRCPNSQATTGRLGQNARLGSREPVKRCRPTERPAKTPPKPVCTPGDRGHRPCDGEQRGRAHREHNGVARDMAKKPRWFSRPLVG